jgi:hypothetical protein
VSKTRNATSQARRLGHLDYAAPPILAVFEETSASWAQGCADTPSVRSRGLAGTDWITEMPLHIRMVSARLRRITAMSRSCTQAGEGKEEEHPQASESQSSPSASARGISSGVGGVAHRRPKHHHIATANCIPKGTQEQRAARTPARGAGEKICIGCLIVKI